MPSCARIDAHGDWRQAGRRTATLSSGPAEGSVHEPYRVGETRRVPRPARARLLRPAEPVGCRDRARPPGSRVQGPGHDQRRLCVVGRKIRRTGLARDGAGAHARNRCRDGPARQRRLRERLRRRPRRRGRERSPGSGGRRGRALHRGLHRKPRSPAASSVGMRAARPAKPSRAAISRSVTSMASGRRRAVWVSAAPVASRSVAVSRANRTVTAPAKIAVAITTSMREKADPRCCGRMPPVSRLWLAGLG